MNQIERLRENVRSVASEAERHWWVRNLEELRREFADKSLFDADLLARIQALIAERSR